MIAKDAAQNLAQERADDIWVADRACRYSGISLDRVAPGEAVLSMTVTSHMLGPDATCARGAAFLLACAALEIASTTRGPRTVAEHCEISFRTSAVLGERLVAYAHERHLSDHTGIYDVTVQTEDGRHVAELRGHTHAVIGGGEPY